MTTLSVDTQRVQETGSVNTFSVIASDVIYEGAAVGLVKATGHARPLVGGDKFVGFCQQIVDNSLGAAAAKNVDVVEEGKVVLSVSGAVITDVGLPIYASDDDTFSFSPVSGTFVGFVHRFVSSGVVVIDFNAGKFQDPFVGLVHEVKSANYTVDAEDVGKMLWVDADAVVITLPAIEGIAGLRIGNLGAYGTVGLSISPNAVDMIEAADVTAADNKDLINTKATANRGDWVDLGYGDSNGWGVTRKVGVWAREA